MAYTIKEFIRLDLSTCLFCSRKKCTCSADEVDTYKEVSDIIDKYLVGLPGAARFGGPKGP